MYVVRLEDRMPSGNTLVMWLTRAAPMVTWGLRKDALRFTTTRLAQKTARSIKAQGTLSIENDTADDRPPVTTA
jgi:hypothetical protein